jgi:hypothetical protein
MKTEYLRSSLSAGLVELRAPLLACIVLPIAPMVLWRSHEGRCVALWTFCAGCFSLAAFSFRPRAISSKPVLPWLDRMRVLAVALSLAWVALSILWIALVDRHDWVALFVAAQTLIPALCIVPYLTLITRKPFAAVVFSAFLLGCAKAIAGIVVNLVYGWSNGHHEMPWTEPNLMLSTFWAAAMVLCSSCYLLGARVFSRQAGQFAEAVYAE